MRTDADLAVMASLASATVRIVQLEAALDNALERLLEIFPAEFGAIQLTREGGLELAAERNLNPEIRAVLASERLQERCFRLNQAVVMDTDRGEAMCALAVPIPGPNAPVGVLVLGTHERMGQLAPELEFLRAVGDQLGVAIEYSRLHSELRAQEQRVRRERLATVGQLAGSLGHDLRGPLINIKMGLELLREESDPEHRMELYQQLEGELCRANALVESLLDFARSREPQPSQMRLQAVLHQAVQTVGQPIDLALASCESVAADPDQMLRLFENLLRNAVDAGGPVRITLKDLGSELEVRVEDSGPGVPEDMRERVFEPLVTTRRKGTGLGLAVCRRTAEAHGGRIWIETSPDLGGACLVVRLPKRSA